MQKGSSSRRGTPQPPQRVQSLTVKQTIRFVSSGNGTVSWVINDVLDQWCVATAATVGYRLCDAVRIRRIEMWGASPSQATPSVTIGIEEGQGLYNTGRSRVISDTVVGQARAAHVVWKPIPTTLQDQFLNSNMSGQSANFLTFTLATGGVIDVTYELILADGTAAPVLVAGTALSGAAAGQIYCRGLARTAGNTIPPVGIATI